jgi:hypothetical protein
MGQFYLENEEKIRPGVYNRYSNRGTTDNTGAIYGICAVPIHASWGPLETVNLFTAPEVEKLKSMYGTGGTVNAALELFNGGASKVYVYRLGTGGTAGTVNLKDTASTPADVLTVSALYPGNRNLSVTIRAKLSDSLQKELIVTEGTEILETFDFAAKSSDSPSEIDTLIATVAEAGSQYITLKQVAAGSGEIATVSSAALAGGTDPTVVTSDYSNAFNALEAYRFNAITVDTCDDAVKSLLQEYIDRVYESGKWSYAVIGDPTSVGWANRLARAAQCNDKLGIYVGGGWNDSTGPIDGYQAVCRICGLISSTPASQSVVHSEIPGAVSLIENLSNTAYEDAITHGMLAISMDANGNVQLDSQVTTLVKPGKDEDKGWEHIRRLVTRNETMDRVDRALAPLVGKVNCDSDGVSSAMQTAQKVLDAMIGEKKLADGATIYVDPSKPALVDSAWFIIDADDLDSLEKIYLHYRFRFSSAA